MASTNPPTYTASQINSIFTHIRFFAHEPFVTSSGAIDLSSLVSPPYIEIPFASRDLLDFLTTLQQHCLVAIPFENVSLHYSPTHSISLDPSYLFHKIVQRGRGGYCMENNTFLLTLLRSLGIPSYAVGARVSKAADGVGEGYGGWSHMVIMVVLPNGEKYALDIGFGANGPTSPLLLQKDGVEVDGIRPARMRLKREFMPENADVVKRRGEEGQKMWVFAVQTNIEMEEKGGEEWKPQYAFVDLEFTMEDFEIANFWTSRSRTTFFTRDLVGVKFFFKDGGGTLGGCLILDKTVVKSRGEGKTQVLAECKNEQERVDALSEMFGIELAEEDQRGIVGLISEIQP